MKKIPAIILVFLLVMSMFSFQALVVSAEVTGETVINLFDGTADGWLDNAEGANLSIKSIEGTNALVHAAANDSISLKRKFSVDWTGRDINNLVIVAKIHIDTDGFNTAASGTLKIKNGDGSDADNPEESNQFDFDIQGLKLKKGWNTLELPLKSAVPDGGDNYKIADWFCLWVNENSDDIQISIGQLDIIDTSVKPVAEVVIAETPAAEDTPVIAETPAPAPEKASANPKTGDNMAVVMLICFATAMSFVVISKTAKKKV